ncbi:hypothetical protein MACH17_03940 [Phaeobacter inhibens]|nr:hypothetical protein MACH17_03940 [Phaeobacter inhibens]
MHQRAGLQYSVSPPEDIERAISYRRGTGPLHLRIDATEIKPEGEGEWNARKHAVIPPRQERQTLEAHEC